MDLEGLDIGELKEEKKLKYIRFHGKSQLLTITQMTIWHGVEEL